MRKFKKMLALLLVAAMAMVMLTACDDSGPSGKDIFIQRVNELRAEYGATNTIVEDKVLDKRAKAALTTTYQKILDGELNGSEWNTYRYKDINKQTRVLTDHGYAKISYIDAFSIWSGYFYNGKYNLSTDVSEFTRNTLGLMQADYVGIATTYYDGKIHVIAVFAAKE